MPEDKKKIITTENLSTVREINDLLYQGKLTAGEGIKLEDNNISVKEALKIVIGDPVIWFDNYSIGSDEWFELLDEIKAAQDSREKYEKDIIVYDNNAGQEVCRFLGLFNYQIEQDPFNMDSTWFGSPHSYDVLTITARNNFSIGELVIFYDKKNGNFYIDVAGWYTAVPFMPMNTIYFLNTLAGEIVFNNEEDNLFIPRFLDDCFPMDMLNPDAYDDQEAYEDAFNQLVSMRLRNMFNFIEGYWSNNSMSFPVKVTIIKEYETEKLPEYKIDKSYTGILSAGEFSKDVTNFEVATAAGVYNIAFTYPEGQ